MEVESGDSEFDEAELVGTELGREVLEVAVSVDNTPVQVLLVATGLVKEL